MIETGHVITLVCFGIVLWGWQDSLRARERAIAAARHTCREAGFQFLDQTVMIARVGLGQRRTGGIGIRRTYRFEFSAEGSDRHQGRAILIGQQVVSIQLDPPSGLVIS